jgi:hypothetical protein
MRLLDRLLAVIFLDHLDRRAHVAGNLKYANSISQRIHRIEVPQAVNRILLAETVSFDTRFCQRRSWLVDESDNRRSLPHNE